MDFTKFLERETMKKILSTTIALCQKTNIPYEMLLFHDTILAYLIGIKWDIFISIVVIFFL